MGKVLVGLFNNSELAGQAVSDLKNQGYTENVTIVTKDGGEEFIDANTKTIKAIAPDSNALSGGLLGGAIGTLVGLLAGSTALTIPGLGLLVAGPLATTLLAATTGASLGGFVGALADLGIPKDKVEVYSDRVKQGDVLVVVSLDDTPGGMDNAKAIMNQHNVSEVEMYSA